VLLRRARRYQETVMPAYTHFQAAVPITFGHYLLGLAMALSRDMAALLHTEDCLDRCPLGAGAVGGTTIAIEPSRTASLLGFSKPVLNSVDAVASRDAVLRLVAMAAILGVTLDRAALDLLTWSTAEFGLVTINDDLVGSSSMMPQKRNPFVLEHVQGRSAAALGAFVGAAAAMRGTSFTNSIAVGSEAVELGRAGLQPVIDATWLLRRCITGVKPDGVAMSKRAADGLTTATALAEGLVAKGVPFRRAHHEVGAAVRAVVNGDGGSLLDAVALQLDNGGAAHSDCSDPGAVRRAADHGGGPGAASFARGWSEAVAAWGLHRGELRGRGRRWDAADDRLDAAVDAIRCSRRTPP
jgi:argininosuccinate lyase